MAKETAEYSISDSAGMSLSMGDDGDVIRTTRKALEMDTSDVNMEDLEDDNEGSLEGNEGLDGEVDADGDGNTDGDSEAEAEGELGEFDADNPEVVEAFEARYVTAEGNLDVEGALSAEYFANVEKGVDGLNEATYAYLEAKGISKATVKQIEAMAATNKEAAQKGVAAHDLRLFEVAGGPDALNEALQWGKAGGYTAEQVARFNKIANGKDLDAKEEAVAALMNRYQRSDVFKTKLEADREAATPKIPKRDATKGQGRTQGGVKPYESRAEMRKIRDALRDNDQRGWALHNQRLKASKFD